jgi:hypothetical protein
MWRAVAVGLVALGGLAEVGRAQSVVRGTVRTKSAAVPIPGAQVILATPQPTTGRTDHQGRFELTGIPPGRFKLLVSALGFAGIEAEAELADADTVEVDVELIPGAQPLTEIAVGGERPRTRRVQNIIQLDEIETALAAADDAHELIVQLRPSYLRGRGAATLGNRSAAAAKSLVGDTVGAGGESIPLAVETARRRSAKPYLPKLSVDEGRLEELDELRRIPATIIKEIRFMSSSDAAIRYGTGVEGGVIIVYLKTAR